jgi:hypothetical protein
LLSAPLAAFTAAVLRGLCLLRHSPTAQVSPLTAPHLPIVPSPTTWAAWTSLHPPRQRVQRVSDFAMNEQARRSSPPNRVRYPTDRQFASGCSPRRFGPTQLPSATELWHTPTRIFTVLVWCPHGRTHPEHREESRSSRCGTASGQSRQKLWFQQENRALIPVGVYPERSRRAGMTTRIN